MYRILLAFIFFGLIQNCFSQEIYEKQRELMVRLQLETRDIKNKQVLEAMGKVPRHLFIPEEFRELAYNDHPVQIGEGQTISQPYMVAYMTQAVNPKKMDRVLEIGTGSGYQAAILGELVNKVYTIEIVEPLGQQAKSRLESMGYENISVRIGDGYNGWPEEAPFDAIVVTAGAEEIPQPLIDQLADGGKMVIPVGPHDGIRYLTLLTKKRGKIKRQTLMPVRFVPFTRHKD